MVEEHAGDWPEDVYGMQSICPYQHMRCYKQGMSCLDACSASGDIWSLGILLALVALGEMPFPGDLPLLQSSGGEEDQLLKLFGSVLQQLVDPVKVISA